MLQNKTKDIKSNTKKPAKPVQTFKLKLLKPISKALVLDPITKKPLKNGDTKPKNTYWMARIREGDVEILDTNKEKK
jgi:hypothetical protein